MAPHPRFPSRRRLTILLPLLCLAAAPPAAEQKALDAQLQSLRAAKPADRPALAANLIQKHVALADALLADRKYPAAVESLRKARGLVTAYLAGPAGQQTAGELDVRVTLAQWREKNDGRGLRAEFFNDRRFVDAVADRIDAKIDFPWNRARPVPGLKRDAFGARWSGFLVAPRAGTYKLVAVHDDGCRIFVDDQPVVDAWQDGAATSEGVVDLTGKPQAIRVELYNFAFQSRMGLHWIPPGQELAFVVPPDVLFTDKESATRLGGKPITPVRGFGLAAEYFDGDFARRVLARVDPDVNFYWLRTRPHPDIGNAFTARWTGFLRAPKAGRYRIVANVDDGVRVTVDDKLVLSRWVQYGVWDTTVDLTGKPQSLVIEYNNTDGDARFSLSWQRVGVDTHYTPIPPSAFFTDKNTAQYAPTP